MPEQKADHFGERGNSLAFMIDPAIYERTFLSLVTETDFSDSRVGRVTEKLTKAYCMGHPALLVGNANSVRFLTAFGFQDWNGILDRTAESVLDPADRFELVIHEVLRQISRIRNDKETWLASVREVGIHNVHHAVSGSFLNEYVNSVDMQVVARLLADVNG
jgi:hypothetical protein